jgi:ankyrin repeat protein
MTALMVAALNCNSEVVALLLKNGADVNDIDNYGRTALMITEDPEVISILKRYGAK